MRIEDAEAALRGMALPRAPRSLRGRVIDEARKELEHPQRAAMIVLRAPRPRVEKLSLVGALIASAAVLCVVLFPPVRPSPKPPARFDELLAVIDDPGAPGRAKAISALGDLAGRKAMPLAARLLEDRDPEVRIAAAELLCFGGAAELGVPALLREGRGFTVLNLLRAPDLWKAMAGARTPEPSGSTALDRVHGLGVAVSMKVLVPPPSTSEERRWASEVRTEKAAPALLAAVDALLRFRDGSPGPYEVVLEQDRIWLVPRAEAGKFWREWWRK
jgi:hypothetical protein